MMKTTLFLVLALSTAFATPCLGSTKLNDQEKAFLKMVEPIITVKERRVFKKRLTTHEGRANFIRIFWAKRDPDLNDNINEFKKDYLARYDFVKTHYRQGQRAYQEITRSNLFLLMGKPTKTSSHIDWAIMGPGYRNPYLQFKPELWVYENVGFDFKRKALKVQFVPINNFGDLAAVTDRLTAFWLRQLKFKLILHPDLEEAPLNAIEVENFQAADLGEEDAETALLPDKNLSLPESSLADLESDPDSVADIPKIKETELNVPLTTTLVANEGMPAFEPGSGNLLELSATVGYFKSGSNGNLVLGRIGFPLSKLGFQFEGKQYKAPFRLSYSLESSANKVVIADSFDSQVLMPNRRALEKPGVVYSEAFSSLLPGDRYTLRVQVADLNQQKTSYFEMPFEVPQLDETQIRTTDILLMDPNVAVEDATLTVAGRPYHLRLSHQFSTGQRIFPVVEIVNVGSSSALDHLQMVAMRDGKPFHVWDLFEEEMTKTNRKSLLIHPILDTGELVPGDYRLRFEAELPSGDILLSETEFIISP